MYKPSLAMFGLTLLALGLLPNQAGTAQTPPLPVCQPWAGTASIYPSPVSVQDNTLFSRSGYPLDHGLTYGGLKSTDRGITWQQFSNPGYGNITFSPNYSMDHTLATAARPDTQVYISTDDGASSQAAIFPRSDPNAFALGDAQFLYLGYGRELPPDQRVPMELQISRDGGQTWQVTPLGLEVDEIAVSPAFAQDRTLLMALGAYHYNGGLLMSTDAGATWTRADTGIDLSGLGIYSLEFSPQYATDSTIFCYDSSATEPGVYKSTDAGTTWQLMSDSLVSPSNSPPKLLISPRYQQDQTLWLVNYYQASISHNGGRTWRMLPHSVWPLAAAEYCQPAGTCGVELFGLTWKEGDQTTSYMYRSYDYGQTWQCLEDPTPPPAPSPPPAEIPEPATWLLLAGGGAGLAGYLRSRQRRRTI